MKMINLWTILFLLAAVLAPTYLIWSASQSVLESDAQPEMVSAGAAPETADLPPDARRVTEPVATSAWTLECVDCPKNFNNLQERSLRLDANGHPHIAYGGDYLYYASYDGAAWQVEVVDGEPTVGSGATLALDADGNAHIAYAAHNSLRYAHQTPSGWITQTVETGDDYDTVGEYNSIAVDSAGRPHIAFSRTRYSYDSLRYARWDGSNWQIENVPIYIEGEIADVAEVSLALDSNDYPHISFYNIDSFLQRLMYAEWDGGNWQVEFVEVVGGGGRYNSLALDSAGQPTISYITEYGYPGGAVKLAHWNGDEWEFQIVGPGSANTSLALDSADRPQVAYIYYSDGAELRFARWDGSDWQVETLDTDGLSGVSLALDAADQAYISYLSDAQDGTLSYLHGSTGAWQGGVVDYGGSLNMGWFNALALDAAGNTHISYFDISHGALKYAQQTASGWQLQTVESSEYGIGDYPSIDLDAAGNPHISYEGYTSGGGMMLKYAYWNGSEWEQQTVDPDLGYAMGETTLALDNQGRPHISYHAENQSLAYTYWDGSAWTPTEVLTTWTNMDHDMALDTAGNPHLCTSVQSIGGLAYFYWDGAQWETMQVEPHGGNCSLALDASGSPHLAYTLRTGGFYNYQDHLVYAELQGDSWITTTVLTTGGLSWPELALTPDGQPRILFTLSDKSLGRGLYYTAWNGTSWQLSAVDDIRLGVPHALALDANGLAHISYYDSDNWDLRYAEQALPPLQLSLQAEPLDGLQVGDTVTFTLSLGSPGLTVTLTDMLPPGLTCVPGSLGGTVTPAPTYDPTTQTIEWQGMLPESAAITFQTTVARQGALVNMATLTDSSYSRTVSATVILNAWRVYLPLAAK
jgi:uncharacterized repeat protein (TIGR01451 family)